MWLMCVIASNVSELMVFASAYTTAKYHREIKKKMRAKKEDGSAVSFQCL